MTDEIGTVFIEDMTVGMSRSLSKVMDDNAIKAFAEVSEDRNPVHLDQEAGEASIFRGRVAHGMLSAGLFSALLGERLPGHGTIYLSQTLNFRAPVRPGERVYATVTVAEINLDKKRVTLDCIAKVGDTTVIKGQAVALAPSRA